MDAVRNPYSPGAGARPQTLAGRDGEIEAMDVTLQRLLNGRDARSQLLIGLRGVGKTVLLNEYELVADGRGYVHDHIEVSGPLARSLAISFRKLLLVMDAKRRAGERLHRALGILKAFIVRLPDGPEFQIDVDAISGPADSGDLASDLAALFVELGEVARDHDTGVFLTIDELHMADARAYEALVIGLHRATQLRLPITVAGAGLPSLAPLTGEARTYAERMFTFPSVGSLSNEHATEALEIPAADEGVAWDLAARDRLLEVTEGYPFFLQEFASATWDIADGPDRITLDDVERSLPVATATLDSGFFQVRSGHLSDAERSYLRAMAELGSGAVKTGDIAKLLGKKPTALSPIRDTLIRRSICYSPRYGELAFTVPMFDQYMKRLMSWPPA